MVVKKTYGLSVQSCACKFPLVGSRTRMRNDTRCLKTEFFGVPRIADISSERVHAYLHSILVVYRGDDEGDTISGPGRR